MQRIKLSFLLLFLVLVINNCSKDEELPPVDVIETGFLSLNISIEIEELPAARLAAVNTDNFIVTIHSASDGSEVLRFEPFSSAPAEIELETGEYFVRATNLEPAANAAFEQPWYYGESVVFNIDKEELKTIDVDCSVANFKVSFVYTQNVVDNFTDWNATATLINEGDFLFWPKEENREGYFIVSPVEIEVYLEYTKEFTGELITRTFPATIDNPQPATHYRVNIDATLQDGIITLNINVDDSFDVIDIDLGDNASSGAAVDYEGTEYQTVQIGDQVWMAENLRSTVYADGTSIPANQMFDGDPVYGKYYTFTGASKDGSVSAANPSGIQGVCPTGWHLPSLAEYQELANYLGGELVAGGEIKSTSTLWTSGNTGATNSSGFTGEPSGWHLGSSVSQAGLAAIWWTSTEYELNSDFSYGLLAYYDNTRAFPSQSNKSVGKTVRCVKD